MLNRLIISVLLFSGLTAASPVFGQTDNRAALLRHRAQAEERANASKAEARAAKARAAKLKREKDQIAADLDVLGRSIHSREVELDDARRAHLALRRDVQSARLRLSESQTRLQGLLGVTMRASREPTPALLTHPNRPVAAARSAILLAAVVESMRRERAFHHRQLNQIARATAAAREVEAAARVEIVALLQDEKAKRRLLDAKGKNEARERSDAQAKERQARALAEKAQSLADLAKSLEEAAEAERRSKRALEKMRAGDDSDLIAALPSPSPPPSVPPDVNRFSETRGLLRSPAPGPREEGAGSRRGGLYILTRAYARVVTPWSGEVHFANNFRNDGKIVIIEPQKGYSIVVAGLASLDVRNGQKVVAGQPIGRMGGPPPSTDEFLIEWTEEAENIRERMFFAIYRGGKPVNTARWLRSQTRKASGS
jgi:septal ring factor EnvC (AmiA/AmiB activator)